MSPSEGRTGDPRYLAGAADLGFGRLRGFLLATETGQACCGKARSDSSAISAVKASALGYRARLTFRSTVALTPSAFLASSSSPSQVHRTPSLALHSPTCMFLSQAPAFPSLQVYAQLDSLFTRFLTHWFILSGLISNSLLLHFPRPGALTSDSL